jgi:dTDP-4-amino-4,6-dideoxygalactose transaminase
VNSIPLVDLSVQHQQIAEEVERGFAEVLATGDFIGGKAVTAFEQEFARLVGAGHCVGVANGTDALEIALRVLGVGAGDEVILPANTFIATAEAVVRAGATPVLVDADEDSMLIDPAAVEPAVTDRTRAVMPVHLYGQCAAVERLPATLAERGIHVVEDAAQSQGARRFGRGAGSLGAMAGTSFYPGKNLGAYGDAGAVVTGDAELARAARRMGAHGSEVKYQHSHLGFNSRLDTLQAVVLNAKLARLESWNASRREAADRYADLLGGVPGVRLPVTLEGNEHVWHLYVVRVDRRDEVLGRLHADGVGAGIHYPVPVHLQPAMAFLGEGAGRHPVSERLAAEILSLPIYPGITAAQQERVAEALIRAVS